jgi:signal transduction histidine kinase
LAALVAVGALAAAVSGSGASVVRVDTLRLLDLGVGLLLLSTGVWVGTRNANLAVGWCLVLVGVTWFVGNLAGSHVPGLAAVGQRGLFLHRAILLATPIVAVRGRVGVWFFIAVAGTTLIEPVMRDPKLSIGWSAVVVAAALVLLRRGLPRRPVGWPEASVAVLTGTVAAAAAIMLTRPEWRPVAVVTYQVGIAVTALIIGHGTGEWRRAGPLPDAMVEVATGTGGPIVSRLRQALGDPDVDVAFTSDSGWVDDVGRPRGELAERVGRVVVDVVVDEAPVACVSGARDSAALPRLVNALEAATAAASDHVRLAAALRAEAGEITRSRRRLVLATDEQRNELARALEQHTRAPLTLARRSLEVAERTPDEVLRAHAAASLDRLHWLREDLQSLASGLGPVAVTAASVEGALGDLARRSGLPTTVEVEPGSVPGELSATVYLVCAELLSNVAKHAAADHVRMVIRCDGAGLALEVTDDGRGGAALEQGRGLQGIADRAASLGGDMRVRSEPGRGTAVQVRFPLGPGAQASPTRTQGTA